MCSDPAAKWLSNNRVWNLGGTFKASPPECRQVYTILGERMGHSSPCVYAIMTAKTQYSYEVLFRAVEALVGSRPTWVIMDFETPAIQAAKVNDSEAERTALLLMNAQTTGRHDIFQPDLFVTCFNSELKEKMMCFLSIVYICCNNSIQTIVSSSIICICIFKTGRSAACRRGSSPAHFHRYYVPATPQTGSTAWRSSIFFLSLLRSSAVRPKPGADPEDND